MIFVRMGKRKGTQRCVPFLLPGAFSQPGLAAHGKGDFGAQYLAYVTLEADAQHYLVTNVAPPSKDEAIG